MPTQGQIDAPSFKIDLCELNEATERYSKPTLIAGACFDVIFKQEIESNIFKEANYNVYGIPPNGSKDEYLPLNKTKMIALERYVRDRMEQSVDKESLWKKCVKALNRKIWNCVQKIKTFP